MSGIGDRRRAPAKHGRTELHDNENHDDGEHKRHEELHRAIVAGQFMPSVPPPLIGLPLELQVRPPSG
jgi:hypothetical protein